MCRWLWWMFMFLQMALTLARRYVHRKAHNIPPYLHNVYIYIYIFIKQSWDRILSNSGAKFEKQISSTVERHLILPISSPRKKAWTLHSTRNNYSIMNYRAFARADLPDCRALFGREKSCSEVGGGFQRQIFVWAILEKVGRGGGMAKSRQCLKRADKYSAYARALGNLDSFYIIGRASCCWPI